MIEAVDAVGADGGGVAGEKSSAAAMDAADSETPASKPATVAEGDPAKVSAWQFPGEADEC